MNAVIAAVLGLAALSAAGDAERLRPRWGRAPAEWIALLRDGRDEALRERAADALADIWESWDEAAGAADDEPPGLAAVADAVGDPSPRIRAAACSALNRVRFWAAPWALRTAETLIGHFPRGPDPQRSAAAVLDGMVSDALRDDDGRARERRRRAAVREPLCRLIARAAVSEDPAMREGAARVLGRADRTGSRAFAFPGAEGLLVAACGDREPSVRRAAASALSRRSDGRHPRVAEMARADPDPSVRRWAKGVLIPAPGRIGTPGLPPDDLLEVMACEWPRLRAGAAAAALERWREDGRLPAALAERVRRDGDRRVRWAALPVGEPGPAEMTAAVAAALPAEPDPALRRRMIRSLAASDLPGVAAPALAERVSREPHEAVRRAAAEGLSELDRRWPGAVPPALVALASAASADGVSAMLAAVGDLAPPPPFGFEFDDGPWRRRVTAVERRLRDGAWDYVPRPDHVPRLLAVMADPLRSVPERMCAARFLLDLDCPEARDFIGSALGPTPLRKADILAADGERHVVDRDRDAFRASALAALIAHIGRDSGRKWGVAELVAAMGNPDLIRGPSAPPVRRSWTDPFDGDEDDPREPPVALDPLQDEGAGDDHSANGLSEACAALGRLRCAAAVPGLVALLDRGVWVGPAAEALGRIGDRGPVVIGALRRHFPEVRLTGPPTPVEIALARLGHPPAAARLARSLPSPPRPIRRWNGGGTDEVLAALGLAGDPSVLPRIEPFAVGPDPIDAAASRAAIIQLRSDDPVAALIGALSADRNPHSVAALAAALGERGDARAVGPLAEAARSAVGFPETVACLTALGRIGGVVPEAVRALEDLRRADFAGRRRHPDLFEGRRLAGRLTERPEDRLPEAIDGLLDLLRGRARPGPQEP